MNEQDSYAATYWYQLNESQRKHYDDYWYMPEVDKEQLMLESLPVHEQEQVPAL